MVDSLSSFQLTYEIQPIWLNQGIATNAPNQTIPITNLTQPSGVGGMSYNDFFAIFKIQSGGTLVEWQFAEYPFASLEVAANAMVQQPLKVSMLMICPASTTPTNNYLTKLNTINNLQNQIQAHIQQGGYFTVYTPAFVYKDVLLKTIRDVTPESSVQRQMMFQWDFEQPLIALQDANSNLVSVMSGVQNSTTQPLPTSWVNTGAGG